MFGRIGEWGQDDDDDDDGGDNYGCLYVSEWSLSLCVCVCVPEWLE